MKKYQFIKDIAKLPFVEEIWLYGSRARGDNQERSDIDIAIVCKNATNTDWHNVVEITENADTLLKIDCVRFDILSDSDKLKHNIELHKYVIYQRQGSYMSKLLWQDHFENLGKAIVALKEVLDLPDVEKISYLRDATIQRFEFAVEIYWKVLKKFLAYEKIETTTPRDVLSKAFQYRFINDESAWLSMIDDRNSTSHIYSSEEALRIFLKIKGYYEVMNNTYSKLKEKFDSWK